MENQVNYIGKGKQKGNKIQISFLWDDLLKLQKSEYDGKKYVVLDMLPLKETGKFDQTHTIIEKTLPSAPAPAKK